MSDYTYTDPDGDKVVIHPGLAGGYVILAGETNDCIRAGAFIANTDAPTVAAELLKAAGRNNIAVLITDAVKAEAWAAEHKLQERRDELALQLSADNSAYGDSYDSCVGPLQVAINRIIELEDAQATA